MKIILSVTAVFLLMLTVFLLPSGKEEYEAIEKGQTQAEHYRRGELLKENEEVLAKAELRLGYAKADENGKRDLLHNYSRKLLERMEPDELPEVLQVFFMIEILEMEVNNGGFHQLFTNPSGAYIAEMLESLDKVGAAYNKSLLETAVGIMVAHGETPESLNKDLQKLELHEIYSVSETMSNEALSEALDSLNTDFYTSDEYLEPLMMAYVDAHQDFLW